MNGSTLTCQVDARRRKIRSEGLNGLDFVEISDDQLTLTVTFLEKAPDRIGRQNVRIDGGRRIRTITVTDVRLCREDDPAIDDCMMLTLDQPGDFSTYTLSVVEPDPHGRPGTRPLHGFDPRYARIDFSFKAGCPTELDCASEPVCPPSALVEPEIGYLAKDYASFRQLILDRLSLIIPDWQEGHVPDIGIALVELLAYAGDYLSYYQDAVATEAYLDTARRRISVRRHVRLIDYLMHDGCNARTWVCVETGESISLPAGEYYFITAPLDTSTLPGPSLMPVDVESLSPGSFEIFEPVVDEAVDLNRWHNEIHIWTWGDQECCLPAGTTRATLEDSWIDNPNAQQDPRERTRVLSLRAGDVLIFEEIRGPHTGNPADADRSHRQAVRLTSAVPSIDDLYQQPVVEIEWAAEDALQFDLCLSSLRDVDCCYLRHVSVARGNVILVDHGSTITRCGGEAEPLPKVPPATLVPTCCEGIGERSEPITIPPTYYPPLKRGPVTHRVPFPSPAGIGRYQALALERIPTDMRNHLHDLWQQTHEGHGISTDDLGELALLFGNRLLAEVGLIASPGHHQPPQTPHQQAHSIRHLLHLPHDDVLAARIRRLEILAQRARAGYLLDESTRWEIEQTWGARYVPDLATTNPAFWGPAAGVTWQDPRAALPVIRLYPTDSSGDPDLGWYPRADLLGSHSRDRCFVAELDDEGITHLRFGDGQLGRAVEPESTLQAEYRIGNGKAGNVAAETVSRIVLCTLKQSAVTGVRNPLPATGGIDPEPVKEVKLFAPATFREQLERAVTAGDYATLSGAVAGIQRGAADLRWNGSWYDVQVAIDPLGTDQPNQAILSAVLDDLSRFRRIGHDLDVQPAQYVPLDIALQVCVLPNYLRADVEAALLDLFSYRVLPDGSRGFFHPDNLTFGSPIYASRIVALAQAVVGVQNVDVVRLQRLFQGDNGELAKGVLALGPLEIPVLDNDRGNPEDGRLTLLMGGGR